MTIFNLIRTEIVNNVTYSSVRTCLTEQKATAAMLEDWKAVAKEWGYECVKLDENWFTSKNEIIFFPECENDDGGGMCVNQKAAIENTKGDTMAWRIDEQNLNVQVAVCVEGGLVSEIITNTDLSADVYDLDVSDFPDNGEEDEVDRKAAEYEKIKNTPNWREVF